jgi:hypothetical protein
MPTHVLYGNQPFETHKVYLEAAAVMKKKSIWSLNNLVDAGEEAY